MSTDTDALFGRTGETFAATAPVEDRLRIWLQCVHSGEPIDTPHRSARIGRLLSYLRDCAAVGAFETAPVETLARAWGVAGRLFDAYEPTSESERVGLLALEARMREVHRRAADLARVANDRAATVANEVAAQVLGRPGPPTSDSSRTTTTSDPANFVNPFESMQDPEFRRRVRDLIQSRRGDGVLHAVPVSLDIRYLPEAAVDPAFNYESGTVTAVPDSTPTTLSDAPRVDATDPEAAARMNGLRDAMILALGAYGAATGVTFWLKPGDRPGTVLWEVTLGGRPIGTITVAGPAAVPVPVENSGRLHNPEEGNRRALDL